MHPLQKHVSPKILAALVAMAALALFGCLAKDRSGKTLGNGGMTPPWDSTHFIPKRLDGYVSPAPDSVFAVFRDIAAIDSQSGEHKDWQADPDAVDTVHINQVFDTGFAFPQNPEATMAYGYDDSFRDDTLFRNAYGNGLFTQEHPCASTTVLSGQFLHPARWLRTGLKMDQITAALGKPLYRQPDVLRYLSHHPGTTATSALSSDSGEEAPDNAPSAADSAGPATDYNAYEVFEGVNFYFRNDSLFAAVLQRSQPCH